MHASAFFMDWLKANVPKHGSDPGTLLLLLRADAEVAGVNLDDLRDEPTDHIETILACWLSLYTGADVSSA